LGVCLCFFLAGRGCSKRGGDGGSGGGRRRRRRPPRFHTLTPNAPSAASLVSYPASAGFFFADDARFLPPLAA
jgi:hypothetical protein